MKEQCTSSLGKRTPSKNVARLSWTSAATYTGRLSRAPGLKNFPRTLQLEHGSLVAYSTRLRLSRHSETPGVLDDFEIHRHDMPILGERDVIG